MLKQKNVELRCWDLCAQQLHFGRKTKHTFLKDPSFADESTMSRQFKADNVNLYVKYLL